MNKSAYKVIHKAKSRGNANHGWLNSYHTFSFASYYNPERINFGLLRVLNDDFVSPGMGFATHSHDNMEIISIPLSGALEHKDSEGNQSVIKSGDVQIMSAGTGVTHSEFNHSKEEEVNFLQIWVFPKERQIKPRYDQKDFSKAEIDQWKLVVSPDQDSESLWINQDAYFSLGNFSKGKKIKYKKNKSLNGSYLFVISGEVLIDGENLEKRDAIGLYQDEDLEIEIKNDSQLLMIEVPIESY